MTSSASVCKFMSYRSNCYVPNLVNHHTAFAVCIPKKIHSIYVFLFRAFIFESE